MLRTILQLGFVVVIITSLGCGGGGSGPKAGKLIAVKGTVNLDNKPMVEGEIMFVLAGQAPTIIAVKDGAYTGEAYIGNNKIEIRAFKVGPAMTTDPTNTPTKTNTIPDRYNVSSKNTAEVAASGANEFKFDVASK